ncbi:MAG: hypothetical protein AB7S38_13035 [Vulcanimicrobiota bacterium]
MTIRYFTLWIFLVSLLFGPALAQDQQPTLPNSSARGPKAGLRVAKLEIKSLNSKDFGTWGDKRVVVGPETVLLRWRFNGSGLKTATWELFQGAKPQGSPKAAGYVNSFPSKPGYFAEFNLPLANYGLTAGHTYTVRMKAFTRDGKTYHTNTVHIAFKAAPTKPPTLDPRPDVMNLLIHLNSLEIVKADESQDEPYLLAGVLCMDGTTIDPANLPSSPVRILTFTNRTHGNLSSYPAKTHWKEGDKIPVPGYASTVKTQIRPLGPQQYDQAPLMTILVAALEEDATSNTAADKTRSAVLSALKSEVNAFKNNGLNLLGGLLNPASLNPKVEAIGERLRQVAIDVATDQTLKEAITPFGAPGVVDPDDYVGHSHVLLNYNQLRDIRPGKPKHFTFDFGNGKAHYRLSLSVYAQ